MNESTSGTDEAILQKAVLHRITVVETLYYLPPREEGQAVGIPFSRELSSSEEAWERKFNVGSKWVPLPIGWVEKPGMLWLRNCEGDGLVVVPTTEERAAIASRVAEIGVALGDIYIAFARVRPGETIRFEPAGLVFIRCCGDGAARCHLFAVES